VNFFPQSACVNTAYSSVVLHEMGHWYNVRYLSGNGSDGFGEGNADIYAMYILNDPVVGKEFNLTGGGPIRDGRNMRQFCGDSNPGCHGGVHNDGEVLMGALWKVRNNLMTTHGMQVGGQIADFLFNSWMNAYNDRQIKSIIETHWLTLDDNDGNIANGTPHHADIDAAFRMQGFPGVDLLCESPENFCEAAVNSTGTGNLISFSGSNSVTAEDFTLLTFGGPPNKFGIFFYGENATQIAFGNGFRCVGGALVRLPATQIDDSGNASLTLDFDNLPNNGPIDAGDIKLFQFWYRDPMAGGAFFNLSDGLRVEFCP
jgi:hypothetical protein